MHTFAQKASSTIKNLKAEEAEGNTVRYLPVVDPVDVVLMNFDELIQILGSHQLIA